MDQMKTNLMLKQVIVLWWMGGGQTQSGLKTERSVQPPCGPKQARLRDHSREAGSQSTVKSGSAYFLLLTGSSEEAPISKYPACL